MVRVIFDVGLREGCTGMGMGISLPSHLANGAVPQTLNSGKGNSKGSYLLGKTSLSGPRRHI